MRLFYIKLKDKRDTDELYIWYPFQSIFLYSFLFVKNTEKHKGVNFIYCNIDMNQYGIKYDI